MEIKKGIPSQDISTTDLLRQIEDFSAPVNEYTAAYINASQRVIEDYSRTNDTTIYSLSLWNLLNNGREYLLNSLENADEDPSIGLAIISQQLIGNQNAMVLLIQQDIKENR